MIFSCYAYKLAFTTPLQTSGHTFRHRKGFILTSTDGQKQVYAETAPLPGFSAESHESVQDTIQHYRESITKKLNSKNPVESLNKFYRDYEIPPSLQFGLDALAFQIEAGRNNKSLHNCLYPEAPQKIPVNALISLQSEKVLQNIEQHVSSGFKTIKCKVGLNFENELSLLQEITNAYPSLTIRVDANQAWELPEAIRNCNQLAPLDIEYCEEPLTKSSPANFEQLYQNTSLPLALDESTTKHSYWPNLLPFTRYLIVKPMIIGSFQKNIETKRLANTHNNKVVVTTSLESGIGRYITAIMAAGLGSPLTAHGLSTGFLLDQDFLPENTFISKGFFDISSSNLPDIDFDQHMFTKLF